MKKRSDNNKEKNHGKNEIRSSKYDLSVQRQHLRDVYGLQYIFFLSVLISLLEENRKTSESIFFILIFSLFRTSKQTIKRTFGNEIEMKVWSSRRNSSPIRLRTWQKETFQKHCPSWIPMMTNIVVDKNT